MNLEEKNSIIKKVVKMEDSSQKKSGEFEKEISEILMPLLEHDGYFTSYKHGPSDNGIDIIAEKRNEKQDSVIKVGIECKSSQVSTRDIYALFGMSMLNSFDRVMVVTNRKISTPVEEAIKRIEPVKIDVVDFERIKSWIGKIETESDVNKLEIQDILKAISRRFALLVSDNPMNLYKLEWRDIERMIAEIFDGMGFEVELTPSSKDGGKDVILGCTVNGKEKTYIVEIKHWRSAQRVGQEAIKDFLNVIVREKREAGLYLSAFGYCDNAFESLSEIERKNLRFGDKEKVVSLCQTYLKISFGIWSPPISFPEILFEGTI